MKLLFAVLFALGCVGLAVAAFLGLAAGSEMFRQCPHGADCPDARSVTAMSLVGGAVCAAMIVLGAKGVGKDRERGR